METLKIGISTCPNDTYIFGAAIRGDITYPFKLSGIMDDVQFLNTQAIKGALDIVKVSFGVFPEIRENYKILKSGGALGFGCGPLLLSSKYKNPDELCGKKIAIPGKNTTAFMVFKMFYPECAANVQEMRFDKIMPSVASGEFDAGLVIHEGRFTYGTYGLKKLADLGELWEKRFGQPIPLGFIALHKRYLHIAEDVNNMIKKSLSFADGNQTAAYSYVKRYAQDMHDDVIKAHVALYVNEYSFDLTKATDAISQFLQTDNSVFV